MNNIKARWNVEHDYNDTVARIIAKMQLKAVGIYHLEKNSVSENIAIARALSDAIKEHVTIIEIDCQMDRIIPDDVFKDENFVRHEMRQAFMLMADEIYNSNHWRVKKSGFPLGMKFRFSIGILKGGENE